jgi:hypothetical protein
MMTLTLVQSLEVVTSKYIISNSNTRSNKRERQLRKRSRFKFEMGVVYKESHNQNPTSNKLPFH